MAQLHVVPDSTMVCPPIWRTPTSKRHASGSRVFRKSAPPCDRPAAGHRRARPWGVRPARFHGLRGVDDVRRSAGRFCGCRGNGSYRCRFLMGRAGRPTPPRIFWTRLQSGVSVLRRVSRVTASAISSSVMVSGGSRRDVLSAAGTVRQCWSIAGRDHIRICCLAHEPSISPEPRT